MSTFQSLAPRRFTTLALAIALPAPILAVGVLLARGQPVIVSAAPGSAIAAQATPIDRSITITGDAVIDVVPDQATLHLAVEIVRAPTPAEATRQVSVRTAKILKTATEAGIAAARIKTDQVTISPEYRSEKSGATTVVGYSASRAITICLNDIQRVDALVDAVVKAGANRLESITFETSDLQQRRAEARLMAVRAAREKATLLAKELGATLGKPRTVTEGAFGWSGPAIYKNVESSIEAGAFVEGSFAPGQMTVNMQVTVIFDLDT